MTADIPDLVAMINAGASPVRLSILHFLADAESQPSVTDIAKHLGLTEQAVAFHFRILRFARIVRDTRARHFVHYTLAERGESLVAMARALEAIK